MLHQKTLDFLIQQMIANTNYRECNSCGHRSDGLVLPTVECVCSSGPGLRRAGKESAPLWALHPSDRLCSSTEKRTARDDVFCS